MPSANPLYARQGRRWGRILVVARLARRVGNGATARDAPTGRQNQCDARKCPPPSGRTSEAIMPFAPRPNLTRTDWPGRNSVMP
jgi:hypothetical protein